MVGNVKLTKTHLKGIVKECLLEILQDGIGSTGDSIREIKEVSRKRREVIQGGRRRSSLDSTSFSNLEKEKDSSNEFDSKIENMTKQMTSDPVLSSILADTAKTTLQEQLSSERHSPTGTFLPSSAAGDAAAREAASSTPEDLFSESAGKWAQLAFSDAKNSQ